MQSDMRAKQVILPGVFLIIFFLYNGITWISSPRTAWEVTQPQASPPDVMIFNRLSPEYPHSIQTWRELIEITAEKYLLDPNLIAAVILQESGGDALAYSSCGAVGLMQVMPNDGIAANFICGDHPCFKSRPNIEQLENPGFNIDYGSHLLKDLIDTFGNWREALRAYGPMDIGYQYADIILNIFSNY